MWRQVAGGLWGLMQGRIKLEHQGLEKPLAGLENVAAVFNRISKRLAGALIASALLITSGLLELAARSPGPSAYLHVSALIGFAAAIIIALLVALDIFSG